MKPPFARVLVVTLLLVSATGCAHLSATTPSPVPLVKKLELDRYAGDWYLIAHIPTSRDVGAHNATERYALRPDGRVGITYRNRLGGFDGKHKLMTPVAKVIEDSGNALWGVRFGWYWPFWYEYRVAHVEADYSVAIVARSKRDFIWLFSRQPQMDEPALARYRALMSSWGYDSARLERVPQQWPNPVDGALPVLGP